MIKFIITVICLESMWGWQLLMNKHQMTERDICTKYITPAVVNAGWDLLRQIREEFK